MKKVYSLILIPLLLSSCGVSIKTVAETSNMVSETSPENELYSNPLIVISYKRSGPRYFSKRLKKKIEAQFEKEQRVVEVILFEKPRYPKLELNTGNELEEKINRTISNDRKDLLLLFHPILLEYDSGQLDAATYQMTGIDTETQQEIWKGTFSSESYLGPSLFAEKLAITIYERLKSDKIL